MKPVVALAILSLLVSAPVPAREVGGVNVPDSLALQGEKTPLVLNGAGYRKKFFIKVYVGALYLAQSMNRADAVLNTATPRAMLMHFVHDVSTDKLANAWNDGIVANSTAAEAETLRAHIVQLNGLMSDMKPGDVLQLDLLGDGTTRVWINKTLRGAINGADFQRAVLKTWLGPHPADRGLKRAVLGEKD